MVVLYVSLCVPMCHECSLCICCVLLMCHGRSLIVLCVIIVSCIVYFAVRVLCCCMCRYVLLLIGMFHYVFDLS